MQKVFGEDLRILEQFIQAGRRRRFHAIGRICHFTAALKLPLCIVDILIVPAILTSGIHADVAGNAIKAIDLVICLLYTSDAADE